MEAHARFSFLWTCAGIAMICCCIAGIMGDIKDDFVYTDLLKTVRRGDKTSLKCEFLGAPVAIYWKKGNDPDQSPTLITWMDGRIWQGECARDNWCDVDENFSLIIRNVKIADTGRYICRVSNYLGRLIYNITDLHVFEPPEEPYPVIKECNDSSALIDDYGCVIPSPTPINLTCSASGFYPDLDLFFLYGSEKVSRMEIQEWTNDDGTRTKSVSISAVPHDTPYVCVASDVPGNQKERAVTVFVSAAQNDDTSTASTGSTTKPLRDINVLIIIVVPVICVTTCIAGVCILLVCWRKHHRKDRNQGLHDHDDAESVSLMESGAITVKKLSFYDLWVMVSKVTPSDMAKLTDTLRELGITRIGPQEKLTQRDAYQQLCQWKSDNVDGNHLQILMDALKKSEYAIAWNNICDERKESLTISEATLKYILSQIGDPRKIDKFLSELIPGRTMRNSDVTEKITKLTEEPLRELREWNEGSLDTNPFVLVSLALESAGCSLVDRTFFFVPDQPVSSDEVQLFVKRLTRRHCKRLTNVRNLTKDEISLIVDENQDDLFDTKSMITDWLAQEHISHVSNIDKRRLLHLAVIKTGRRDLKDYFGRYDYSTKLPDAKDAEYTIMESSHGALIPSERKEDVCLVELADIAFRLMMTDVYPLADALKMSHDKLKQYKRKSLSENKLSRGTIGILEKFCQSTNYARSKLCDSLASVVGLQEMAHLLRYGYQVSHSDLFSVAQGGEAGKEQCARIRENLGIISEAEDTLDMLRDWRSMITSPTYNPKVALADAVFPVFGEAKAHQILSGAVISSGIQSGNVISFIGDTILYNQASHIANILGIKHSCSDSMKVLQVLNVWKDSMKIHEVNDAQREQLCRRLSDKGFKNFSSKLRQGKLLVNETGDFIEEIDGAIQRDVTTGLAKILDVKLRSEQTPNIKDILQKWEEKLREKSLEPQERINLSNKLFKEGYMEFSLEIMIGLVPKPLETTKKETTKKETTAGGKIKEAATLSAKHLFQASLNTGGFASSEPIPPFV